jgi:hypothetical protein
MLDHRAGRTGGLWKIRRSPFKRYACSDPSGRIGVAALTTILRAS